MRSLTRCHSRAWGDLAMAAGFAGPGGCMPSRAGLGSIYAAVSLRGAARLARDPTIRPTEPVRPSSSYLVTSGSEAGRMPKTRACLNSRSSSWVVVRTWYDGELDQLIRRQDRRPGSPTRTSILGPGPDSHGRTRWARLDWYQRSPARIRSTSGGLVEQSRR